MLFIIEFAFVEYMNELLIQIHLWEILYNLTKAF